MNRILISGVIITLLLLLTLFFFLSQNSGVMNLTDNIKEQIEQQPGQIIDVRTSEEHNEGHLAITDSQYDILNGDFQKVVPQLDKNKTYYLYCRSGNRSGQAAKMMRSEGFEHVYNIGGYDDLVRQGFESKE